MIAIESGEDLRVHGIVFSDAGGSRGVDGRSETADLLHWYCAASLLVVVESGEDLRVQDLEFANTVHHLLQALETSQQSTNPSDDLFIIINQLIK